MRMTQQNNRTAAVAVSNRPGLTLKYAVKKRGMIILACLWVFIRPMALAAFPDSGLRRPVRPCRQAAQPMVAKDREMNLARDMPEAIK